MQLTKEQEDIINSTGNIKINAVAGSGKTTTVIEYARTRPIGSKILYLAFNKSVKIEALKKFADKNLNNVQVETAHSLAFRHIVPRSIYKIRSQGYKTNEIAEILNLRGNGEKHTEYIIANHVNKFIAYFCNSDKSKVQDLNYLDTVNEENARAFVLSFYKYIETQSRLFLSMMDKGEIEITHDFYLKKFQLSNPQLNFDYILFDEGQDASPAMLDVFFKQNATKVIVGDTNQQIYGWRFAVNSLEKANFKTYHLTSSFRFGPAIAELAMEVLKFKKYISNHHSVPILGLGNSQEIKTKATLARTNLGLLLKAIEYVTEKKNVKHIYFEGNINSYTYADDGASLYDVLNLYNNKRSLIKDKLIKSMNNLDDLADYIKKTEDVQLAMMLEILKEYGNQIPGIIKSIKEKHVENDEKEKAEMIFSTVHRCKGMEYDSIQLVDDFISEEKLEKLQEAKKSVEVDSNKLNEEINLLYVAITRTRNRIHIPETLLPIGFEPSPQIHVLKVETEGERMPNSIPSSKRAYLKDFKRGGATMHEDKPKYKDSYQPWTSELDSELTQMYCEGVNPKDIAKHFGRSRGTIAARIRKLELEESYG